MTSITGRRENLQSALPVLMGGLLLFAVISCADGGDGTPAAGPPNLILIMADDAGAGEFGAYGNPENPTPNLSELARTGVQFSTCYATPVCRPTRMEIMTGQYGHHNGVYQFSSYPGGPPPGSPVNDITQHLTFAQVLKERGYATAMAGKWQLSGRHPTLIREAGFDEYCMYAYERNLPPGVRHTGGWEIRKKDRRTSRYWHPAIVRNGEYVPTDPDSYGPDLFTDFVIDFARRHRDRPFFIYYPMALTHVPYVPTPDTLRSGADRFDSSAGALGANVRYIDKLVGRIVGALDELGLRDNTIVFFTSDNGTIGDGKGMATELGARVPMIVNGPGLVEPLHVSDELIDLSDVLPTLVELAGADLPRGHIVDGRSIAPILRGERANSRDWIYSYIGNRRIVRTRRWLLEDNTPQDFGRLYDCGDSRDGSGCREVTDSSDAEVLKARRMMQEILADKPVPEIDPR